MSGGDSRAGRGALGVEADLFTAEVLCVAVSRRFLCFLPHSSSASSHLTSDSEDVPHCLLFGFILSWVG